MADNYILKNQNNLINEKISLTLIFVDPSKLKMLECIDSRVTLYNVSQFVFELFVIVIQYACMSIV